MSLLSNFPLIHFVSYCHDHVPGPNSLSFSIQGLVHTAPIMPFLTLLLPHGMPPNLVHISRSRPITTSFVKISHTIHPETNHPFRNLRGGLSSLCYTNGASLPPHLAVSACVCVHTHLLLSYTHSLIMWKLPKDKDSIFPPQCSTPRSRCLPSHHVRRPCHAACCSFITSVF